MVAISGAACREDVQQVAYIYTAGALGYITGFIRGADIGTVDQIECEGDFVAPGCYDGGLEV